jgi:hypothetical protein
LQQFVDPRGVLPGPVNLKRNFRRTAQVQAIGQLSPDVPDGCAQPFEGGRGFVVVALHRHVHARGTGIIRQSHAADRSQADPRVSQLAFENGFNLLAQGFP